jgi:AraC-like DNA-binding protein
LARKLHLSESQVYRKLKAISGKSIAVFIRSVRLQRAKELILTTDRTISEISYDVGFNDPSWFSRVFKEEFGFAPSDLYK